MSVENWDPPLPMLRSGSPYIHRHLCDAVHDHYDMTIASLSRRVTCVILSRSPLVAGTHVGCLQVLQVGILAWDCVRLQTTLVGYVLRFLAPRLLASPWVHVIIRYLVVRL